MLNQYEKIPFPWRGILIGCAVWTADAVLQTILVTISAVTNGAVASVSRLGIFLYNLHEAFEMGVLSIGFWYMTIWLVRKPWQVQVVAQACAGAVFIVASFEIDIATSMWLYGSVPSGIRNNAAWIRFAIGLRYLIMLAIWYTLHARRQLHAQREREKELRLLNTQMELAMLKSQLNPHFLFNALNIVNALVGSNPDKARTVLAKLADVLRYTLDSDRRQYVPLAEELEFVQTYLEIEKERFGNRLESSVVVPSAAQDFQNFYVPPMILQPLVENAVRHGLAPKEEGGRVMIVVERSNGRLLFSVSDTGVGMAMLPVLDASKGGRGLAYTDARLRKLFGDESGLNIASTNAGAQISFTMPLLLAEQGTSIKEQRLITNDPATND